MVKTGPGKEAQRWIEASLRHEDFVKQVALLQAQASAECGIVESLEKAISDFVITEANRRNLTDYECAITTTSGETVVASFNNGNVGLTRLDTFAA